MSALDLIREELTQILTDKGADAGEIAADTPLLNGPLDIDSLDWRPWWSCSRKKRA